MFFSLPFYIWIWVHCKNFQHFLHQILNVGLGMASPMDLKLSLMIFSSKGSVLSLVSNGLAISICLHYVSKASTILCRWLMSMNPLRIITRATFISWMLQFVGRPLTNLGIAWNKTLFANIDLIMVRGICTCYAFTSFIIWKSSCSCVPTTWFLAIVLECFNFWSFLILSILTFSETTWLNS